jgi:autotransporter-associated beta strand protein
LQAHKISASTTYFNTMDRVQVQAGGAFIDTTNSITCTVPLTEDPGSTGGGLTKSGAGVLVLPAGNTYSGPTVVSNGLLSLVLPVSSSALTLRPNTTLSLAVNNSSWNANSATFDGNTSTLNLDFALSGPTTTPLLVGTLAVNGTTVINVSGTFTLPGTYPLIDYTTRTGAGSLQLGTRPAGVIATLVTNVGTSSIDLVVSDIANDLVWTGNVNGDWDIGLTANWDFLTGGSGATTYNENASGGDYVTFLNGAATGVITLKTNVKPIQMVFQNSGTDYSISGASVGITGNGKMMLQGGGLVTLSTSNSFTGGVSNNLGFVAVGNNSALGNGPVTLWPTLTGLKTTGLFSDSTTARTIANPVQFRSFADNELNFQLGDPIRNGKLTFTGPVTLSNRRNDISMDSNVEFTGSISDGSFSKTGPGTLTVKGTVSISADDQIMAQGDVIIDGATWTNNSLGVRLVAIDGDTSRVILTNNSILTFEGGGNLRVAGGTEGSFTQGNGTNEFIMYSGQLNCIGSAGEASIGNAASLSAFARITLNGGTATVRALRGLANAGPTALVLNGATVRSAASGLSLPNFISGFTNAQILAAGVTIDVSPTTVATVSQDIQGAGGLTKIGTGVLLLNGTNSYSGTTLVNAGTLGGNGLISGPVSIGASGTIAPGSSIGTLTINNSLTLAGTTFAEVNKANLTSDLVNVLTDANYGGTLVISNVSATPLAGGEVFQLFNVSGAKNGNFSNVTMLPASGVSGTFNPATGQLTITANPVFVVPFLSGGNLIWTGTGFTPDGTYSILTSTNVAAPLSTWTTNTTGAFSGSGALSQSIPVGPGSQRFFMLKTP